MRYIFLLLLFPIFCTGLILSPDSQSLTTVEHEWINGSFTVTYLNTSHSYDIFNVTVSPILGFVFETIHNMTYNTSQTLHYRLRTNATFQRSYIGSVRFYYLTDDIYVPETHILNIGGTGVDPYNITVHWNDTIIFMNIDSVNHRLIDLVNATEYLISPGSNLTFLAFRNYSYIDDNTASGVFIWTDDNHHMKPTINPSHYSIMTFNVHSVHKPGTLTVQMTEPSSPIEYNQKTVGVLVLRTNSTIYGMNLSSDSWLTFSENNFDIEREKIITFTVSPKNITRTDDTDKAYHKDIRLIASNINGMTASFSIFILQHNFTGYDGSAVKLVYKPLTIEEQRTYCDDNNWEGASCQKYLKNVTWIQYINRTLRPELSEDDVYDNQVAIQHIETDMGNLKTNVEGNTDAVYLTKQEILDKLNDTDDKLSDISQQFQENNDYIRSIKRNDNMLGFLLWGGGIIILTVIVSFFIIKYKKHSKKVSTGL